MEEKMFCKYCGEQIPKDSIICPKCGRQLSIIKNETNYNYGNNCQNNFQDKPKFYTKTWFMWLMLFLLPPIGIALMWKYHSNMKKNVKIAISVIFGVLFLVAILTNGNSSDSEKSQTDKSQKTNKKVEVTVIDFAQMSTSDIEEWANNNKIEITIKEDYSDSVEKGGIISQSVNSGEKIYQGDKVTITYSLGEKPSQEFLNALKKAETYSNYMHMSKQAIYDQLVSEYGENFEADAAQYAVDNVKADWNYNALKSAETYSNALYMSKQAIYDQLISEYGDQFTTDQAQYAVDNIDADWNANALNKAKSYRDNLSMSKNAIYDQLISEYGEKFTSDQAQYAIDHMDD